MHNIRPDLIILDEAQRIRNWATATARIIKQMKSRYAFCIDGYASRKQLEELLFGRRVRDGRRLGPAFRFLKEHRVENEEGKLTRLSRPGTNSQTTRAYPAAQDSKEVLPELPKRTDQIFRVR